ncbi:MAG: LPS assembly protein LptD, partial [Flavobacteriaceae bacterium]
TIENQKVNELKENKKRGHIKSTGSFNLSSNSYLDYKIHRATDRNYLNTYKYKYEDTLESNIKVESIRSNNFYSFQSYLFQDLRNIFDRRETPKVLPRVLVELNSDNETNSLNYNTNIE